jgi:hypothetical protein
MRTPKALAPVSARLGAHSDERVVFENSRARTTVELLVVLVAVAG